MKNTSAIAVIAVLLAAMLTICGCSACSREMMYESSALPEKVEQSAADILPEEEPEEEVFEPEEDIKVEEELPPLIMEADFEAVAEKDGNSVLWGPGTFKDELGRSTACIDLQEKYGSYNAYFITPAESNTVTLSFDQGYENGYTAPILDALKEKDVQAIFFLTGHYVRTQPELIQRMIDEGHILGSHSDAHAVYCKDISIEESFEDAKWMQDHLRENYGYEMRLFRFPEGEFSEQSLELMRQLGYKSVFWSFAYADWNVNEQPEPTAALEKITSFLHPGEIMLLHSVSSTNAEILPQVIDAIRDAGFEAAVAPELLK